MKLWLDDIRPPPDVGWMWCQTPWKALEMVVYHGDRIEEWSLDHDLGEHQKTGYDFLKMIEMMVWAGMKVYVPDTVKIHSANPVGAESMWLTLASIKKFQKGS